MDVIDQPLPGVTLFRPAVFEDRRGTFFESASPSILDRLPGGRPLVQLNVSRSHPHVLRGLHYQVPPRSQGKLVRVTHGAIFDVVVDVRGGSPTFGQWTSVRLDAAEPLHLWIPPGFAHGFCVLGHQPAEVCYGVTTPYSPQDERTLLWRDPAVHIDWPLPHDDLVISEKDRAGTPLDAIEKVVLGEL